MPSDGPFKKQMLVYGGVEEIVTHLTEHLLSIAEDLGSNVEHLGTFVLLTFYV